jgi:uncharacterized protein involved in response to NO
MVFGVAAAAIAGFLLTAAPVWVGRAPLVGRPLAALAALWLAGRVAMLAASTLPAWTVAAIDLAFLPALALALARTLWRTGQVRNYGVVALVALLALTNAAIHAQAVGRATPLAAGALRFGVDVVIVLVVVIGGRITPSFTANALLRRGIRDAVRSPAWADRLAVAAALALAFADLLAPRSPASGVIACVAGFAVAVRMAHWQTRRTLGDPLLWSLHAGAAWVACGFLLVGVGDLGGPVPMSAGLHALTAGAIGSMLLAVMTRVSLGHTGRPLVLPPGAVGCYWLVHAGALARAASALAPASSRSVLLVAGGLLWASAFLLFAVLYAPILTSPRVDGGDG